MGAEFAGAAALAEVDFDQCSSPISAEPQKTTAMHCTQRVHRFVLGVFGHLRCTHSDHKKSLQTTDGDGIHFNTAVSEVYSEGMCRLIVNVIHLLHELN